MITSHANDDSAFKIELEYMSQQDDKLKKLIAFSDGNWDTIGNFLSKFVVIEVKIVAYDK